MLEIAHLPGVERVSENVPGYGAFSAVIVIFSCSESYELKTKVLRVMHLCVARFLLL